MPMGLARRVHFSPLLSSVLEAPGILGRLAELKLKQETSSHEPSLRRCLGHYGVFKKCMTAAQENTTEPSVLENDPHRAPPKSRHASETHPRRSQITTAINGIVHRSSASITAPESDEHELSRVQARGSEKSSSTASRSHHAAPKMFFGWNPFARFKQKLYDRSVG
ncbi:hypothetical protein BDW62DRAFT_198385 [Aspergillus aurantiobrunneus]